MRGLGEKIGACVMAFAEVMTPAALLYTPSSEAAATQNITLAWNGVSNACYYMVQWKETPGFIGESGTNSLLVSGLQTGAVIQVDPARHLTAIAVRAVGAPTGMTCTQAAQSTTPVTYRYSGTSNLVHISPYTTYYQQINSTDTDKDKLPDNMEYAFTLTDPYNANTTGVCGNSLTDSEAMIMFEAYGLFSWFTGTPRNALTDSSKIGPACTAITGLKTAP